MGLALVTRIPNLMEAHIVVGALRSAGIAAELFDGNFGAVEAPVIEGLGGYRVMAPEEDVAEARDALRTLRASPGLATGDDESPWGSPPATSSRFRSKGMRLVAALFLGGPFLVWLLLNLLR